MSAEREDGCRDELEQQLKNLVRSTKQLTTARFEADEQLRRIHALNTFSLQAATAPDPERILGRAGELLLELFPLEQTLGLVEEEGFLVPVMVRARSGCEGCAVERLLGETPSVRGGELDGLAEVAMGVAGEVAPELKPLLKAFETLYAGACEWEFEEAKTFIVVLPLRSQRPRRLGFLLARATRPDHLGAHETLPTDTDRPFLALVAAHLAQALDNALLHTEVSELAAELEQRVARRTGELARANEALDQNLRQLEETQAELLHAGRMAAVGTLVAGVSHELSKPVLIIEGYAKALLEAPLDTEGSRKALRSIERQANRCADLIEGLLAYSRKPAAPQERYPVEDLVSDVTSLARSHAEKRKVTLRTELELRAVPEIEGIRSELQSALLNLVSNAVDATASASAASTDEKGEVTVTVTPQTRQGRPGVLFTVRDLGDGISDTIREQIFDPFFTTKAVGEGVGLGLALADRIASSHQGALEIGSTGAAGTRMQLWLPAA